MRIIFLVLLVAVAIFESSCGKRNYTPDAYLTHEQQDHLVYSVIRYAAKIPPNSTHELKFDEKYDKYYNAVAKDYDVRSYYIDKDSIHYFLITRAARSVTPMRESIGGMITYDRQGKIKSYEEIFRTWKMPEAAMNERYPILFDKMVKGESLEPYYAKNKGDQYIEFPTERFVFDKQARRWRDLELDSLNLN